MPRLFISQQRLGEWLEEGRVQVNEDHMTLEDGREFRLAPAVCFLEVIGDEADRHGLVGKVKTKAQLEELSAEHYRDSVILGETGYQVQEGFIGEPLSQ